MTVKIALILTYIIMVKLTKTELSKFIFGGEFSKITDFPYSALINVRRDKKETTCGASVLNQEIILTAAHCVTKGESRYFKIIAFTGAKQIQNALMNHVIDLKIHEYFNELLLHSDIALLRLDEELALGKRVKRIIIMKDPPKAETAVVAGWGIYDPAFGGSVVLRHTNQQVLDKETCSAIVKHLPIGTLCARDSSYPGHGDSGSALVIKNNAIQIGLVSFKIPAYSNETVVYTDISFYQHWIRDTAFVMYCENELLKQQKERLAWQSMKEKKQKKTRKPRIKHFL